MTAWEAITQFALEIDRTVREVLIMKVSEFIEFLQEVQNPQDVDICLADDIYQCFRLIHRAKTEKTKEIVLIEKVE